jgi:hypothetical protein
VAEKQIDEFLFDLPRQAIDREERLRLIREAIENEDGVTQEHLDRVMCRLLEELQRRD